MTSTASAPTPDTAIVLRAEPPASALAVPSLAAEQASAKSYASAARADNTRRAYSSQWGTFCAWCEARALVTLPADPATVALYLASLADAGRAAASIDLALAAISQAHKLAGHASPRGDRAVREVRAGIRRTIGTAQKGKAPLLGDALRLAVDALPAGLLGARDRALLVTGFLGGFRRSELVALNVSDLRFGPEGVEIMVARSKTDQEGQGQTKCLPYQSSSAACPVRALRAWLDASQLTGGAALFVGVNRWGKLTGKRLAGDEVARIVKRAARAAGFDAAELAGHSLRSGFATAAAMAGKSERSIMRQTGHRSERMVRRYIKIADAWKDNAGSGLLG